jgi:hypothetical protein
MKLKTLFKSAVASNADFLYLKFSTGKDFDVELVERPGKCLPESALILFIEEIREIAREANRGFDLNYGILEGSVEAVNKTIVTVVRSKKLGNKIVDFNAMRYVDLEAIGETLIHMGLVLIALGTRGGGLSWLLYSFPIFSILIRNGFRPLLM